MFVIIGIAVVLAGVLGGFMLHGGPLQVLLQWSEFLIIGGAGVGSLLVGTPLAVLKDLLGGMGTILKGDPYGRDEYVNLLKTMYELFNLAKRDGLISIESHITAPEKSPIFTKNPFLLKQHHALDYLCDTMKLILGGGVPAYDLEALLDADIETMHEEERAVPTLIQKLGDALPGLGIVAAVLGIVITMQAIDGPPAEIGEKVAAALVGTFLGILMSYGFIQPLSSHLELLNERSSRYLVCIKAGVTAYAKGNAPVVVVEFARRVIFSAIRPSFDEVEKAVKSVKAS
ncbi:MAG TPA: flagellar motor stator protein MotA [Bacteroidota bacterium]|nr:flagellar motor stator protein MotA [Bacteroidota bacterium]